MNIIVFSLQACPVASLGPYGNEWIATPNLDRFAAEGVVFDQHFTPNPGRKCPLDFRSLDGKSILLRHQRVENDAPSEFYAGWGERFDARPDPADRSPNDALLHALPPILDRLATIPNRLLWIEMDRLLPPWHIPQDVFEAYIDDLVNPDPESDAESDADAEGDSESEADDQSESDEEEQSVNAEMPEPWRNPETGWFDQDDSDSWELLHRSFAAAVTVFDAGMGKVFDLLRERKLDETAAWVFTADRGLPLGEHGIIGTHRPWLHQELVQVPLFVRLPNAEQAGRRVDALTQTPDLMPTLIEILRDTQRSPDPRSKNRHGVEPVSLVPLLHGGEFTPREFVVSEMRMGDVTERLIRTKNWAYLVPGAVQPEEDDPRPPMLFAKPDDRWEVNDLRTQQDELCDELHDKLQQTLPSDS